MFIVDRRDTFVQVFILPLAFFVQLSVVHRLCGLILIFTLRNSGLNFIMVSQFLSQRIVLLLNKESFFSSPFQIANLALQYYFGTSNSNHSVGVENPRILFYSLILPSSRKSLLC